MPKRRSLTEDQVRLAKRLLVEREYALEQMQKLTLQAIADEARTTPRIIHAISMGETYRDVGNDW